MFEFIKKLFGFGNKPQPTVAEVIAPKSEVTVTLTEGSMPTNLKQPNPSAKNPAPPAPKKVKAISTPIKEDNQRTSDKKSTPSTKKPKAATKPKAKTSTKSTRK